MEEKIEINYSKDFDIETTIHKIIKQSISTKNYQYKIIFMKNNKIMLNYKELQSFKLINENISNLIENIKKEKKDIDNICENIKNLFSIKNQ